MSVEKKIGDTLRIIGGDEKVAVVERTTPSGEFIEHGLALPVRGAADIRPDCDLAVRQNDGTYKVDYHTPGPAMVNSNAYKAGWARIFGGGQDVGQA